MGKITSEIDLLRYLSQLLGQAGIDFMLTGSMAMNYYTQPRMTRDLDLVVALKDVTVSKLVSIFQDEFYILQEALKRALNDQSMFNAIHLESIIKVDFIPRKETKYRRTEFDRRKRIKLKDFYTWIVSKEDLIISKLEWMRGTKSDLQRQDIKNLLGTGYDESYFELWIEKLALRPIGMR